MKFEVFVKLLQNQINNMIKDTKYLFVTNTNYDELWNLYLDSFPPETNKIFRKKRYYDCSCCRKFIKSFGNVVSIIDNKIISIWDFETNDKIFQPVINKLSEYVKSKPIINVFISNKNSFGIDNNYEIKNNEKYRKWNHLYIKIKNPINDSIKIFLKNDTINSIIGNLKTSKEVLQRSFNEISEDSIKIVIDLINQNSLYKGIEFKKQLNEFLILKKEYDKLNINEKELFCWKQSSLIGESISRIRNHSIGTLLTDINKDIKIYLQLK